MSKRRENLLRGARGRVLELGAGTGLNLNHYPEEIEDDCTVMVAPAERLPFEDDSFDTVVSTLVLCTVDDPRQAIDEIARVLRPGGQLLFLEHVRSDSPRLARWQDRLHQPWHAFAAGCNANRATVDLLSESALQVQAVDHDRWSWMPVLVHPLAIGSAQA
jgi:SAM-dependent methyltransferase